MTIGFFVLHVKGELNHVNGKILLVRFFFVGYTWTLDFDVK